MGTLDPLGASRAYSAYLELLPRWTDTYFVDLLRESQGGEELDVVWLPQKDRMRPPTPEELKASPLLAAPVGCWAVILRYPATVRTMTGLLPDLWGVPFVCQVPMWGETPHLLDGNFGDPLVPGPWLIDVMCETDRTRHSALGAKANRRRAEEKENQFRRMDALVRDAARPDNFFADPLHRAWRADMQDDTVTRDDELRVGRMADAYMETRENLRAAEIRDTVMPTAEQVK